MRANHPIATLISYIHIIFVIPLAVYVILIPSKINTHKCKLTNGQIQFLANVKFKRKKIGFLGKEKGFKEIMVKVQWPFQYVQANNNSLRDIIFVWMLQYYAKCGHSTHDKPMAKQIISFFSLTPSLSPFRSFTQ